MTPNSENFEALRQLLALKRHEVPPPGYFHGFSREVIIRIKAGEGQQTTTWWLFEGSWLRRFWAAFEARPILAGGFGVAVCGFFVAGALISSESTEITGLAAQPGPLPTMVANTTAEATPLQRTSGE